MANISFNAKSVTIDLNGHRQVNITAEDVDIEEVVGNFDTEEVFKVLDKEKVVDFIGKDDFMEYFGIEESEE